MLDEMRADIKRFTPEQGYNLVGVDDFEMPGKQLYLIGHFATRAEAEAAQRDFNARSNGDKAYIYGPEMAKS